MSHPNHPNILPSSSQLNDGPSPQPAQSHTDFIHNFSNISWEMDNEPPPPNNPKYPELYYLLTITGQLLVAYYPHERHELGDHYLAWAPLRAVGDLLQ